MADSAGKPIILRASSRLALISERTLLIDLQIAEVKNYFTAHKKEIENKYERIRQSKPSNIQDGPVFLFSSHTGASDIELRSELPSKSAVEKLVTRYFNSYDPGLNVIHSPNFRRQLQAHWEDPSKTTTVWLGLLYSIMAIAMHSYHKVGDEPPEWKGKRLTFHFMFIAHCLSKSCVRPSHRVSVADGSMFSTL